MIRKKALIRPLSLNRFYLKFLFESVEFTRIYENELVEPVPTAGTSRSQL